MASTMKQGKAKVATKLKGVYTLNPTKMVMKSGSQKSRKAVTTTRSAGTKYNKPTKAKGK